MSKYFRLPPPPPSQTALNELNDCKLWLSAETRQIDEHYRYVLKNKLSNSDKYFIALELAKESDSLVKIKVIWSKTINELIIRGVLMQSSIRTEPFELVYEAIFDKSNPFKCISISPNKSLFYTP